jgi:signal transduction histidine kinase
MKLRNYTLRYLIVALLAVIALWATLFYMVIIEEVYDNIDDGLKNSKLLIIREAMADEKLLDTPEYGIHQFTIKPLPKDRSYDYTDHFINTFEYMEYDEDNEPVRLLQTVFDDAHGNPHRLTIRASMVEEDELMEDLMIALIALYIMLVLSIGAINHFILRKVWGSFYQMLDRLKGFRLGTGSKFRAPTSPVEEFKMLGKELENLLERNEAVFLSQKQFIENASHELQTPLAIALNKLELYVESNDLDESQMIEIGRISDTLSRLVRLNKSLLLLSKIENRQFAEEEEVNFNAIAETLADDFADLAKYKDVALKTSYRGTLVFTMNKGLAVILISNLVKNAIIHTPKKGEVEITIHNNVITVANTATAGALDKEIIFKRFYHGTENESSTGLGLAIVQSIANTYGLKAAYAFDGRHNFSLNFPLK